jgi:hypothetical protein
MRTYSLAFPLLCSVTAAACATHGAAADGPQQVLAAYAEAVLAGKHDEAYALMSPSYRARHTKKEFVSLLRENPAELKAALEQLRSKAARVEMEASVDLGQRDTLRLVAENGVWKIASDPLDFYGQRTPAEALRSFVRALERRRYDIVLRFVPSKWADTMTVEKLRREWGGEKRDEIAGLIKNLKVNLAAPIHEDGNRATMPYGERHEVRFVCEGGIWKIEDPD